MAQVACWDTGESTKNALTGKVFDRKKILALPNLEQGGKHENLDQVQEYLKHYGYLPKEHPCTTGTLDEPTCGALSKFQKFYKLPESGALDVATKEALTVSRCGFPDVVNSLDFLVAGPWDHRNLKYCFGKLSSRVSADASRNSIRRAFDTWTNTGVGLTFTEVAADKNPDIFVEWRQANDPDHSMVGNVLAHADFPPGFSIISRSSGPPLPLHYDDQEHAWVDGAVPKGFDIETVGLHELGHCLGLYHSDVVGSVMYPSVGPNLTKRALTPDDLNAIRNLYPPESGAGPNLIGGTGPSTESVSTSSVSASDAGAPVSWKFLGGTFEGEPAVVSMFAGHLDIFVRGNDSYVWHKAYQDGNGWWPSQGDWEQLGNSLQILSDVTAVSWGSSRIDIFGRGIDNSVQHRAWTGSSWTGWENLGGQCIGNICASTGGENNLHVFIRGMDNGVYHKSFNGSWTPDWENLGGKILGQPRAVSWGDSHSAGVGRVDVFVRGTDNAAYQKTWTGAVWEPAAGKDWKRLGGIIMDDVVPVVSSPTSIDLFVLGTNSAVFQKTFNGTRWLPSDTDWTSLGGILMSNPAATTWGGNRIEIFGQGTDNAVWQNSYDGSAWSGWKTLGGVITESPVVTTRGSSRPQVFVRGTNAALYESV